MSAPPLGAVWTEADLDAARKILAPGETVLAIFRVAAPMQRRVLIQRGANAAGMANRLKKRHRPSTSRAQWVETALAHRFTRVDVLFHALGGSTSKKKIWLVSEYHQREMGQRTDSQKPCMKLR